MFPRFIKSQILEAINDSPVVYICGARQVGKTTLVKQIVKENHFAHYLSLDDLTTRSAAMTDPNGFLQGYKDPIVLDEVQLVPELFPAIKKMVDENRRPGRFLITGSANVLTLPRISESLAGRLALFTLYPLSQGELGKKTESYIDTMFSQKFFPTRLADENQIDLYTRVINGGYPEIQNRSTPARKEAWFKDYITTILQRDIRELSNINGLTQMPRLLELLATRLTCLLNFADLSRAMQIPQTSLKRYLTLFENTFLIQRLPPWSGNLGKRLVKTPKVFFVDSGLVSYLLGIDTRLLDPQNKHLGPLLENFVLSELLKQASWSLTNPKFFHFQSQTDQEVDIILENRQRRCVGIEVKASSTVRSEDFNAMRWLEKQMGDNFIRGIVLYTGFESLAFGKNLYALPVSALWCL
ncbi:ATP-binding protein [candidate division KSB1 bacterium]|nr:ATP-binding protein [candidate division KSB1 bacterium]RQW04427.1 MAG: ATP-binding protein [candidate division KSB1 bacterium]